ncbi:MAG: shikimate dehydrogenase family protein [Moheibacter sp.]
MNHFGLIGKNISYSFSEKYFTDKFRKESIFNSNYKTIDLNEISEINHIIQEKELKGFNVTIPFKEQIIPYLDELDSTAKNIGAVNCVKVQGNKKIGFNTDVYGFKKSFQPLLQSHHKSALILGSGGASKAVCFVLNELNIPYKIVSRVGGFTYKDVTAKTLCENTIIINTTPVGTFPKVEEKPSIPYAYITEDHLLFDLIYNPSKSKFLQEGEIRGAKIKNGYEMLVLQAEKSWEIWNQSL